MAQKTGTVVTFTLTIKATTTDADDFDPYAVADALSEEIEGLHVNAVDGETDEEATFEFEVTNTEHV